MDPFALKAQRTDLKAAENMLLLQHKEMKAAESTLLLQLADTQTRLRHMDCQIARIANSTTPLYSLPDEIIVAIIHVGNHSSCTFPILMSHISHRMRELAIGSPTLWTSIDINLCLDKVKTYLSRSRPCLLSIFMRRKVSSPSVRRGFGNDEVVTHFSAVSAHAHRLESLDLRPMNRGTRIPPQLFASAPMLSKMRLSSYGSVSLDSIMSLPATITSLELLGCSFSSCDHFYRFILTMPNLTNLKLSFIDVQSSFTRTHTTISLPSLVNLQIFGYFEYLQHICELIAMPSLRHLKMFVHLDQLHSFATWLSAVTRVCGSPYPAIRWLEFDFREESEDREEIAVEAMKKLIHGFPDVMHVSIGSIDIQTIDSLMCLCDDTAWPHLDTLTLKDYYDPEETFIVSTLCSVITARPTIHHLLFVTFDGPEFAEPTGITQLREHVHVKALSICMQCEAVWDSVDGPLWDHVCNEDWCWEWIDS